MAGFATSAHLEPLPEPSGREAVESLLAPVLDTPDRHLRILTGCQVNGLVLAGDRVTGIVCDGPGPQVVAAEYILAMGPLESERLLARSGVARAGDARSVGLSVAVELAAEYEQPVYSGGGADDARHFVLGDGVVVSSGTRSPAEWALRMPGFLDEHEYNMLRCAHIAYTRLRLAVGSPATVRTGKGAATQVGFDLSGDDRERLMKAIYSATEALFASGATRVVPLAFPYVELRPPAGAELLRTQDLELSLTDAFVTGGFGDGVVDADFRVPEMRNLRMIDAGLLPTALPAPQLGVMALASWAATRML